MIMPSSQLKIATVCDDIKNLLLEKNAKYGDSALNPSRVFSKSSTVEQLLVRIDDKLSRIQRGAGLVAKDEDVVNDLIGYLVLLKIALKESGPTGYAANDSEDRIFFTDNKWDGSDVSPEYQFYFSSYSVGGAD